MCWRLRRCHYREQSDTSCVVHLATRFAIRATITLSRRCASHGAFTRLGSVCPDYNPLGSHCSTWRCSPLRLWHPRARHNPDSQHNREVQREQHPAPPPPARLRRRVQPLRPRQPPRQPIHRPPRPKPRLQSPGFYRRVRHCQARRNALPVSIARRGSRAQTITPPIHVCPQRHK